MTPPLPQHADVLDQGFACKVAWWRRHVPDPWWPPALDALPQHPTRPAYERIARQDVFGLADDPTPEGRVRLLLAAYIWGTGDSGFLVGRRVRVFTKTPVEVVGERLVAAATLLDTEGAVAAYEHLLARQPLHIKYLGPAFFTKYLYFAAGQPPTVRPQPLTLDKYVARALNKHHGWDLRDTGWSASTYGRYLNFAADQAQAAGPDATPDAVEVALFTS
ncbi:MAG: hypothetical protein ACR2K2_15335 [Mycobacteriales bacterium]